MVFMHEWKVKISAKASIFVKNIRILVLAEFIPGSEIKDWLLSVFASRESLCDEFGAIYFDPHCIGLDYDVTEVDENAQLEIGSSSEGSSSFI